MRERTSIVDVISEHVTLQVGRRRQPQGPVPVPRREDPVVQRRPPPGTSTTATAAAPAATRSSSSWTIEHLTLRRGGGAARRPRRHPVALRRGRARAGPRRSRASKQRLVAANAAAAEFYAEQLGSAGGPAGPRVPGPARLRPGRRRALRLRLRPATRGTRSTSHLRKQGFSGAGADHAPAWRRRRRSGSLIDRFRRRLLWPIRDLTGDVIGFGARKLLRGRRRPEVPEHPRDAAVQEVARALRDRPGQAGDRQAGPGGHRRGLHRRDGLPPGRRADRRGDLRHRLRRPTTSGCCAGC